MRKVIFILLILFLVASTIPVYAQDGSGNDFDVDTGGAWGEVVDANGNILYNELVDLGVVNQDADWMPTIPGYGQIQAEYHMYQTSSGNIVVMPTATTLLFMAINPFESGFDGAASQLGNGMGVVLEAPGLIKALLGGYLETDSIKNMGYSDQDVFFQDVINGKTNIFTALGKNVLNFLQYLIASSWEDKNIYTMLLLYTPDMCNKIPGGCPEGAFLPENITPPDGPCPSGKATPGKITATAGKTAPNNVLVVGQDPEKRGADLWWELRVAPTIYTYWKQELIVENVCVELTGTGLSDCTTSNNKKGLITPTVTGWKCEQYTQIFQEKLNWGLGIASLSQTSRDWILTTLSIRYPRAFLHNPYFSFAGAAGGFLGDGSYRWRLTRDKVQLADPGYFNLMVNGSTSGTPVTAPRGFSLNAGQVPVWLKEVVIIK